MRSRFASLLALACAGSCGGDPDTASSAAGTSEEPLPLAWFTEEAAERGLAFTYESGHADRYLMPEIMGGGAALFDMDGDGDLDAYLVQGGTVDPATPNPPNLLFRNDGSGAFEDVTDESGAGDRGYGMGVACGDVDGDGATDLYVTNFGANALYRNAGTGRFEDRTADSGSGHPGWGTSAAFFDPDRDGDLDLYVVNYLSWTIDGEIPCNNRLSRPDYCSPKSYRLPALDAFFANDGSGVFADRSVESGVASEPSNGLGIGCGDFDADGWEDVFVANDGMSDFLWKNGGDGTFENIASLAGCAVDENGTKKAGMGVALADVDVDGDLDILVCNLSRESDSLYLNQGGFFADRTSRAGLAVVSKPFTRFGMAWLDFDHDGELDLFQANGRVNQQPQLFSEDPYAEPNLLFRGRGKAAFVEVEPRGGTDQPLAATSRAAAFGDVDGDGALDILVVNRDGPLHLMMNRVAQESGRTARWIQLQVLESSGRNALGATVELVVGGRRVRRDVRAAYSYLASNDPRVHIGLGDGPEEDEVREAVVRWIDGRVESFGPLKTGRVHVLRRGQD